VVFRVAIGTQDDAFFCLDLDLVPISVGKRSHVQLKELRPWIDMVKLERSKVSGITADHALTAQFHK
jgi:hypothetical protein